MKEAAHVLLYEAMLMFLSFTGRWSDVHLLVLVLKEVEEARLITVVCFLLESHGFSLCSKDVLLQVRWYFGRQIEILRQLVLDSPWCALPSLFCECAFQERTQQDLREMASVAVQMIIIHNSF